jgi:hypothetical protein
MNGIPYPLSDLRSSLLELPMRSLFQKMVAESRTE